jgi:PIN domain nuclease of toxin-antitoxin system
VILLDTHVLVWWLSRDPSLSPKAKRAIALEVPRCGLVVSAVSVLEIATLCRRKRLAFSVPLEAWLADVRSLPELQFEPVTDIIAQLAGSFDDDMHGDPVDRVIAATAISLGAALVTADGKLRGNKAVRTIW